MAGTPGLFTGWDADGLCVISREPMASIVGDAFGRRGCISRFVRELRQCQSAVVTGWEKDCVHFESRRKYFTVGADDPGRGAGGSHGSRAEVLETDGTPLTA